MRPEDYPPQEPFSEIARPYVEEVTRRGADVVPSAELSYGSDPYQTVAIHASAEPNGDVLVFVHGGGWTSGYKEHMNFMAPAFVSAGVTFCSAGYRLAPLHVFPAGRDDVADAIAAVSREIRQYGGDPSRLFIGGHSAGGHYASLLAVTEEWRRARALPPNAVRGCLPLSGVYLFGEGSGLSVRPRFLGPEGNELDASPVLHVKERPCSFLIAYGSEDFPHLKTQAEAMAEALRGAGGDAEVVVLDARDHFGASLAGGEADGPWVPRAVAWMAAH